LLTEPYRLAIVSVNVERKLWLYFCIAEGPFVMIRCVGPRQRDEGTTSVPMRGGVVLACDITMLVWDEFLALSSPFRVIARDMWWKHHTFLK
jgi:hypothetical protein